MKYSEFETIAKESGWEFDEYHSHWLYAKKLGIGIAISKTTTGVLKINTDDEYCGIFKEKEFIEACYELAETPLEDRKGEKQYIVELPFLTWGNQKISLNSRSRDDLYWSDLLSDYFTEKEIKEIDPRLWEFAVEVEGV